MTKMILSPFSENITADGSNNLVSSNPTGTGGGLLFTPTYMMDAESATLGSNYIGAGSDQWSDAATLTIAQNTNVLFGSKAWQMTCPALTGGFGNWGGIKALNTALVKGDSIHSQFSTYMPTSSVQLVKAVPHLKYFRYRTYTSGGGNVGYQDIYLNTDNGSGDGAIKHIYEGLAIWTYTGETIALNTWETFEYRIDFDNVSLDLGGTGRIRIWRAKAGVMTLILDITDQKTLVSATDECRSAYMFTYWNGEPAQPTTDQVLYADRVIIETDMSKLVETDSNGYKIIGGLS
jgi:hypothetical protein